MHAGKLTFRGRVYEPHDQGSHSIYDVWAIAWMQMHQHGRMSRIIIVRKIFSNLELSSNFVQN
jgi:hypothetical protein